jgi:hypothetical protein
MIYYLVCIHSKKIRRDWREVFMLPGYQSKHEKSKNEIAKIRCLYWLSWARDGCIWLTTATTGRRETEWETE